MKLQTLARGDPQGALPYRVASASHARYCAGVRTPRAAEADHEEVLLAGLAAVAIILLINTVEFEKLVSSSAKRSVAGRRG